MNQMEATVSNLNAYLISAYNPDLSGLKFKFKICFGFQMIFNYGGYHGDWFRIKGKGSSV